MIYLMDDQDRSTLVDQVAQYLVSHPNELRMSQRSDGYVYVRVGILLHRVLMNAGLGQEVDHRNGRPGDNRRDNLDLGTPSRNRSNQRASKRGGRSTSKYRGVCLHRSRKNDTTTRWRAHIKVENRGYHLGYFTVEEDAARAFDRAALAHHGPEYRWLNFPNLGRHMSGQHPEYAQEVVE